MSTTIDFFMQIIIIETQWLKPDSTQVEVGKSSRQ